MTILLTIFAVCIALWLGSIVSLKPIAESQQCEELMRKETEIILASIAHADRRIADAKVRIADIKKRNGFFR